MTVGTAEFGQADLFKTETHTEAPMAQLGRAAASESCALCLVSRLQFQLMPVGPATFGQAETKPQ